MSSYLALAYTMDGQAGRGEELLRQAQVAKGSNSDPRLKQNLDLVMGLQGKAGGTTADAPAVGQPPLLLKTARNDIAPPVVKVSAKPATSGMGAPAAAVLDPDQVIRAAMEAETAKANRK